MDQRVIESFYGEPFFDKGRELEPMFDNPFRQGKTGLEEEEVIPEYINLAAADFVFYYPC